MSRDIAIDEIRAVRTKISAKYHHDTRRLLDHYRKMEKNYKDKIIPRHKSLDHKPCSKIDN